MKGLNCHKIVGLYRTAKSAIRVIFSIGFAALLLFGTACNRSSEGLDNVPAKESSSRAKPQIFGKVKETSRYWEAVNKIVAAGIGIEALKKSALKGDETDAEMASVFRDIAQTERERSRAIAALPLVEVEPTLAKHALATVQVRRDLADALSELAGTYEQRAAVLNPDKLIVGLLAESWKQKDDPDRSLFSVAASEFSQTKTELEGLAPAFEQQQKKMVSLQNDVTKLNDAEMGLRLNLTQTFGVEFRPFDGYFAEANQQLQTNAISLDFVLESLDGKSVGGFLDSWDFDKSTQKLTAFQILGVTNLTEGAIAYTIQVQVEGLIFKDNLKLRLTYRPMITRLKMIEAKRL